LQPGLFSSNHPQPPVRPDLDASQARLVSRSFPARAIYYMHPTSATPPPPDLDAARAKAQKSQCIKSHWLSMLPRPACLSSYGHNKRRSI
jgi:hypothetical protein